MDFRYRTIDQAVKTKFLTSQADAGCLAMRSTGSLATRFVVGGFTLKNRSGVQATLGLAGRLPINLWKAGQCDALNAFTDDTTNAQANVANGFNLGTAGTVNTGIILLCRMPFNLFSLVVTTPATGGTAFSLAYSTGIATWTPITGFTDGPDWTANGERLVHFPMPGADWAIVAAGHGASLPADGTGWYGLRILELAGNVAAGKAQVGVLGVSVETADLIQDQQSLTDQPGLGEIELPPQCDGMAAIFSIANDGNMAKVRYRMAG